MRLTHPSEGTIIECDGPLAEQFVAMGWLTGDGTPVAAPTVSTADDGLTRGQRAARTRAENKARKEQEERERTEASSAGTDAAIAPDPATAPGEGELS